MTKQYLENSLRRLSIFCDRPVHTKDEAFEALIECERLLLPEQVEVVKAWLKHD